MRLSYDRCCCKWLCEKIYIIGDKTPVRHPEIRSAGSRTLGGLEGQCLAQPLRCRARMNKLLGWVERQLSDQANAILSTIIALATSTQLLVFLEVHFFILRVRSSRTTVSQLNLVVDSEYTTYTTHLCNHLPRLIKPCTPC